jgi:hypothetical protein
VKAAIFVSSASIALACSARTDLVSDTFDGGPFASDDGGARFDAGPVRDAADPFHDARVSDAPSTDAASTDAASTDADSDDASDSVVPDRHYIKASNPDANDWFGHAVALTDHWLAIGARHESSWATGFDGDQLDDSEDDSGAVYLFEKTQAGWAQRHYIKASNTGAVDGFGDVLALHGSTLVVGAPFEDSAATGIDGDQGNSQSGNHGAVYLFVEEGGTWRQEAYVKASNTNAVDLFGSSVALEGDTLVIGAPYEDSAAGINGDQADNSIENCGAVYVFERTVAGWAQTAYLKGSGAEAGDQLGTSVAISGSTIVAGARGEPAGAAYVFERDGTSWREVARLTGSASTPDDAFGSVVALHGETLAVGAPAATTEEFLGPTLEEGGAVYVFERDAGAWAEVAYLKDLQPLERTYFGIALALHEDTLLVGAIGGGEPRAPRAGSVHEYVRSNSRWAETQELTAANAEINDRYGGALAITPTQIAVGAIGEASDSPGIDGDAARNSTPQAGAVYLYAR